VIAGRYSLSKEIGRERSDALWLGLDERAGRRVVLQQVGPADPDRDYRDLAEREARAVVGFVHPHVAAVHDLVVDDETGRLWLVSQPVEGTTLARVVHRKGAHDRELTVRVARQAADALAAAHAEGIVHGDVSPANITIDRQGNVKVTGFGIAWTSGAGSPAYLAPEVAAGKPGNRASDVWSLGATLYFATTGRPPYDIGPDLAGGLERIVAGPPPRLPNAGLLGSLLEVTMVKDPWRRWSMAAVRDHVNDPSGRSTDSMAAREAPRESAPTKRWEAPVLLLILLLLAAGVLGVTLMLHRGPAHAGLSDFRGYSQQPSRERPATGSISSPPEESRTGSASPQHRSSSTPSARSGKPPRPRVGSKAGPKAVPAHQTHRASHRAHRASHRAHRATRKAHHRLHRAAHRTHRVSHRAHHARHRAHHARHRARRAPHRSHPGSHHRGHGSHHRGPGWH
jgi:serine/threonine protein kinase